MPRKTRVKQPTQRSSQKRPRGLKNLAPRSISLPRDVLFEIFSYLKDDIPMSYSLINRDFVYITRKYLFHKFTLNLKELVNFFDLIKSPYCSFTCHVRKLQFHKTLRPYLRGADSVMNWSASTFQGRMAEILRVFPNVNWVCLPGFPAYPSQTEPCNIYYAELDQVETLILQDGDYEGGSTFVEEILSAFRYVRKLECEKLTFTTGNSPGIPELERGLLPRLTDISLHNPRRSLVELVTTRLSVNQIQRLSLKTSSDDMYRTVHWEQLVNKIHSNDQYFTLELSKIMGAPSETWSSYNLNPQNIHTLIFNIKILTNLMGCSEASWIPEAIHGIKMRRLHRLIFNIEVYNTSFFTSSFLWWWPKDGMTRALDNLELSVYLEEIVINFRSNDNGATLSTIKEALDPEGRRGWWEGGVLKVNIEHKFPLNISDFL